ncbi:hypothetical protein, partial [Clavibacter michiganensis]|uniref:hypothetical protein n=1 Tax=Clavibacter michiganensis TaxID=28447 RepID=UPI00292DB3C2
FTVGWGQAVTGVDPTLDAGTRLSGLVRGPDGTPYAGAGVYGVPEATALLGADPPAASRPGVPEAVCRLGVGGRPGRPGSPAVGWHP